MCYTLGRNVSADVLSVTQLQFHAMQTLIVAVVLRLGVKCPTQADLQALLNV